LRTLRSYTVKNGGRVSVVRPSLIRDSVVFGFQYAAVVLMGRCRRHNAVPLFFDQRNNHDKLTEDDQTLER